MDENQERRLEDLRQEERRLNRAWEVVAGREEWTEAARTRKEYGANFDKLLALWRELNMIE